MNQVDILEKRYLLLMGQKRDWNFFIGLYDYIKFYKDTFGYQDILDLAMKRIVCDYEILDDKGEKTEVIKLTNVSSVVNNEVIGSLSSLEDLFIAMESRSKSKKKSKNYPDLGKWLKELELIYSDGDSIWYDIQKNSFSSSSHPDIFTFSRELFEIYTTRVHLFLIEEFGKESQVNEVISDGLSYDRERGVLCLRKKQIEIRKTSRQYEVLNTIFNDLNKDWQYSEIMEEIDPENYKWKLLYDVIGAIKRKVATETGVKNLFITTTQSVKVNSEYLK